MAKSATKNKLGVKNSSVNNINVRKKKGVSRAKSKSTISKKSYDDMKSNWGRKNLLRIFMCWVPL
ncbi:MAG TPA: hypothetical protein VKT28_16105 [Puia sp.]|nr:hypothetical protein [Puia sp.]